MTTNFKANPVLRMTIFLVSPFTRPAHIWRTPAILSPQTAETGGPHQLTFA